MESTSARRRRVRGDDGLGDYAAVDDESEKPNEVHAGTTTAAKRRSGRKQPASVLERLQCFVVETAYPYLWSVGYVVLSLWVADKISFVHVVEHGQLPRSRSRSPFWIYLRQHSGRLDRFYFNVGAGLFVVNAVIAAYAVCVMRYRQWKRTTVPASRPMGARGDNDADDKTLKKKKKLKKDRKNRFADDESWEEALPNTIPIASLIGVFCAIFLMLAFWPVYHLLTPFILTLFFLGLIHLFVVVPGPWSL